MSISTFLYLNFLHLYVIKHPYNPDPHTYLISERDTDKVRNNVLWGNDVIILGAAIFFSSPTGSNQTWNPVARDWSATNVIFCIGGGSAGANGGASAGGAGGGGGGGGSFAKSVNLTGITAGGSVTYQIATGGTANAAAGNDTWFNAAAFPASGQACGAKGGAAGTVSSGTGAAGGLSSGCYTIGTGAAAANGGIGVTNSTGSGNKAGGGGGGAGGPSGVGATGTTTTGGTADNGVTAAGTAGAEWVYNATTAGSGGGGAGGAAGNNPGTQGANYGAGGGGAGKTNAATSAGGNGAPGIILATWVPPWIVENDQLITQYIFAKTEMIGVPS